MNDDQGDTQKRNIREIIIFFYIIIIVSPARWLRRDPIGKGCCWERRQEMVQRLVITDIRRWRCFDSRSTTLLTAITRIRRPPLLLLLLLNGRRRWSTARLPATIVGRRDLLLSRHLGRPRSYIWTIKTTFSIRKKVSNHCTNPFSIRGHARAPLLTVIIRENRPCGHHTSKKKKWSIRENQWDYFKVNCGFGG